MRLRRGEKPHAAARLHPHEERCDVRGTLENRSTRVDGAEAFDDVPFESAAGIRRKERDRLACKLCELDGSRRGEDVSAWERNDPRIAPE